MTLTKNISVGNKLYLGVLTVFVLFAVAFIVFQQNREKQYKIDTLNIRLQDYNKRMAEMLSFVPDAEEATLDRYVATHTEPELRVTIIDCNGRVCYDNRAKDYAHLPNHISRPEVREAIKRGMGSIVERSSATLGDFFFYSATYFPQQKMVVRSALPYDDNLAESLKADQHYVWFAVTAMILLVLILYRFTNRLGDNITKLRAFADRADAGGSLDSEDLIAFPADELGAIAEKIVKIYKRLQSTRKEQDILKRQLTQNIAHELKTPVASIQGYLETILDNPHINEATKQQFLQRSYAQAQRLTSLLQDISTLNRMDDAPDMMDFASLDIAQIVAQIGRETALQLQERHMAFVNQLPVSIPMKGNPSLIYSVFRNLTDNAIAYAGDGTTITLQAEESPDEWHFTFADNGNGVPSEHLPRLFERFYRVDKGRSRKMGGTGLGLAIVKNAVMLHGGTISAINREEGGLQFDFTLKKQK